jgi:hypothetical protein
MPQLAENVRACFYEHKLLTDALVELMKAAKPYIEPYGSPANHAMAKARSALEGKRYEHPY